jgi:GntR family transcriptional regulator / MocR family aminotransferase
VTCGYAQARGPVCRTLAAAGAKRVAIEDPSHPEQRAAIARAGLEAVPIPVDRAGIRVDALERAAVDGVILTVAHQFPTGTVLSGERRTALLSWLRRRAAIAIEDDYDAEYQYDRAPLGALQGLEPDRVVYAGSASKTLVPALRLGWLVFRTTCLTLSATRSAWPTWAPSGSSSTRSLTSSPAVSSTGTCAGCGPAIGARRAALVQTLADALPEAVVGGVAAGLHPAVQLPRTDDEQAILDQARRRRNAFTTMSSYRIEPGDAPPTLMLGYAQAPRPRSGQA